MLCASPLELYRSSEKGVTASRNQGFIDKPLVVPCGKCFACRANRKADWACRMVHETVTQEHGLFINLTYDDEHVPWDYSVQRKEMSNFVRRLRKARPDVKTRYYGAAEYGEKHQRPHYHLNLWGYDPPDPELHSINDGNKLFTSWELTEIWGKGTVNYGAITYASAAYVAGYVQKKITGPIASDHYQRIDADTGEIYWVEPEFSVQSLRPGIGYDWFQKFGHDAYVKDEIIIDGKVRKPPRYYDKLCEKYYPDLWQKVRIARRKHYDQTLKKRIEKRENASDLVRIGTFSEEGLNKEQIYAKSDRRRLVADQIQRKKPKKRGKL